MEKQNEQVTGFQNLVGVMVVLINLICLYIGGLGIMYKIIDKITGRIDNDEELSVVKDEYGVYKIKEEE